MENRPFYYDILDVFKQLINIGYSDFGFGVLIIILFIIIKYLSYLFFIINNKISIDKPHISKTYIQNSQSTQKSQINPLINFLKNNIFKDIQDDILEYNKDNNQQDKFEFKLPENMLLNPLVKLLSDKFNLFT